MGTLLSEAVGSGWRSLIGRITHDLKKFSKCEAGCKLAKKTKQQQQTTKEQRFAKYEAGRIIHGTP